MVAADVHGKNHHVAGCFGSTCARCAAPRRRSRCVECRDEHERELFRATLGGMGLTGHILEVEFQLVRVPVAVDLAGERARRRTRRRRSRASREAGARVAVHRLLDRLPGARARARSRHPDEAGAGPSRTRRRRETPAPARRARRSPSACRAGCCDALDGAGCSTAVSAAASTRRAPCARHRPPRDVLLSARRGARLEPHLRPARLHPVPVRAARGRAVPGAVRRFLDTLLARARGASFLCVIKDCGAEGDGLLSFPRPGISFALDLPVRRETAGAGRRAQRVW